MAASEDGDSARGAISPFAGSIRNDSDDEEEEDGGRGEGAVTSATSASVSRPFRTGSNAGLANASRGRGRGRGGARGGARGGGKGEARERGKSGKVKLYEPTISKNRMQSERLSQSVKRALGSHDKNAASSSSSFESVPNEPIEQEGLLLLQKIPNIADDEEFGGDEKKLNEFIVQHPMLSLESTSQKTLQLVSNLFKNATPNKTQKLPVVSKTYDDEMLRPANKNIGERDCVCGNRCMASFLARWRHGPDTDLSFVCCEFLLPEERKQFLNGGGLPHRRKKCILCSRYFTSYVYYRARMDPNFRLDDSGLGVQSFANSICTPRNTSSSSAEASSSSSSSSEYPDHEELMQLQRDQPIVNASLVSSEDGYDPSVLLFADEEYYERKNGRNGKLSAFLWQPIVKFSSLHYRFQKDDHGIPFITQVGVSPNQLFRLSPTA
jgi:hypothetical protein